MGFIDSCFQSAQRRIDEAQGDLDYLLSQYRQTPFWRVFRLIRLSCDLTEAENRLNQCKQEYRQLWY